MQLTRERLAQYLSLVLGEANQVISGGIQDVGLCK